jgi:hypothetical protein
LSDEVKRISQFESGGVRSVFDSARQAVASAVIMTAACSVAGCASDVRSFAQLAAPEVAKSDRNPVLIALRPIGGPHDGVTKQLVRQLNTEATKHNIALMVDHNAMAPRTVQGNVWLRPDFSGLKLVYSLDVLNEKGDRIDRLRGEEPVAEAAPDRTRWDAVTAAQTDGIATRIIGALNSNPIK